MRLIPALFMVGSNLPQLLSANLAERLRYKKPFVLLIGGVGERLPYGLIATALFLFAGARPVRFDSGTNDYTQERLVRSGNLAWIDHRGRFAASRRFRLVHDPRGQQHH